MADFKTQFRLIRQLILSERLRYAWALSALITGTLLIYLIPLVPQAVLDVVFNETHEQVSQSASRSLHRGLRRHIHRLPIRSADNLVTLGEGDTPQIPLPAAGKALGLTAVAPAPPLASTSARYPGCEDHSTRDGHMMAPPPSPSPSSARIVGASVKRLSVKPAST